MKHCALIIALSAALAQLTQTVSAHGIQYVQYNRDKIPAIVTAAGIATEIIFEDDETIEYSTFGFSSAWESQIVRDHILVFKAKDEQPETNLIVHTNKRDYLFTVISGNNDWKKDPNSSRAVYSMRMTYRDGQSKAALAAKAEAEKVKAEQAKAESILRNRDISPQSGYLHTNYDYRATAYAGDLIPHRMWDNGTLTYIAFKPGTKRGVVYELDHNRKSHLVNQHTEKNGLLVVHGVYQNLIIRLGDDAVEIRRNTQGGRFENDKKTSIDGTVRTVADTAPTAYGANMSNQNLPGRRLSLAPAPTQPATIPASEETAVDKPALETAPASKFTPEIITITAEPNQQSNP